MQNDTRGSRRRFFVFTAVSRVLDDDASVGVDVGGDDRHLRGAVGAARGHHRAVVFTDEVSCLVEFHQA